MRAVLIFALSAGAGCLAAQDPVAQNQTAQEQPTAIVGLRGLVYYIKHNRTQLPNFEKLKPAGPAIYASSLNLPPQSFTEGFPGVTDRNEWFAIDYSGRFWIADPGMYTFSLLSDDGSKLYIDERVIIDNDGLHTPLEKTAAIDLAGGLHHIRVSYFQGPKYQVALVLKVAGAGQEPRVFSTDEFKPPPDPGQWRFTDKTAPPPASAPQN
jgi:hypothetical protein